VTDDSSTDDSSTNDSSTNDYDVVVVGSGFGGSVAALRLAEKGYRVHVIESGRRFADEDFAKTSWDLRRYLWAPRLKCFGVQRIHRLPDVMILAGAGVGGGSLNYANTLYVPPAAVSANPGVNPALTITAQAERAMSFWPNRGGEDPRPKQGTAYERLAAVVPTWGGH
jgi:choline dehydrogenase-like flavoprotein